MSKDNVGGAAFPTYRDSLYLGMNLRDYFATKAMQGLMSTERANQYVSEDDGIEDEEIGGTLFVHTKFLAKEAYMIADAMLKAREE
jgi:hypothetical protein